MRLSRRATLSGGALMIFAGLRGAAHAQFV
jgi:hypothetical protein